jgi:plasmid stabilization system protein ParE
VARFPYVVFHVVGDEVVDVWRIPHTRRDIPSAMGDEIGA